MPTMPDYTVYKATYSGTPVYEFIAKGIACMRRRSDSWINATQILKVADFDKPQRTRILEREVQRGVHEKVQGGYGKYQGTWVPLDRARAIAAQYNVEELLMPIFNFRPSTESPPLAPKHITAASTKPRPARAPARPPLVKRATKPTPAPPPPVVQAPPSEDSFEEDADVLSEIEPLDEPGASVMSSSPRGQAGMSDMDMDDHPSQHSAGHALKRKRGQMEHEYNSLVHYDSMSSPHGHRRLSYSDELLDYFMTKDMDVPEFLVNPPADFGVDDEIDTEGHTAIHWAAAMGDLRVIDLLVKARANITATNHRGETPLMRAVLFTNNYDRRSFPRLVETLRNSIFALDKFGSSVFHHIAATTSSRNKLLAARYYDEVLLQKLSEVHTIDEIAHFLDAKDMNGDTALTISARNVAKKCVRTLLGYNASPDIPNNSGETADRLIIAAEEHRKHYPHEYAALRTSSSSPFQPHPPPAHPRAAQQAAINYATTSYVPQPHTSEAAIAATKKAIPQMAEMLEGLATAFDKELHDKEEDHLQAQQLLASSTRDIEHCRQTSSDILAPFSNSPEVLDAQITNLKAEAEQLAKDLKLTLERSQTMDLTAYIAAEENALPEQPQVPADQQSEKEIMEKLHTARELVRLQNERRELMGEIVKAYAKSGAGGKMADYRRLIALSCSLLPDDVEKLLPEILKDLEAGGDGSQGVTEALLV